MNLDFNDSRLGKQYEDTATGLIGTCVGIWVNYGGTQLHLAYLNGGDPKFTWIDQARLKMIHEKERPGF